jgi:hypothetical protein
MMQTDVKIASGESLSTVVDCLYGMPCGIVMPAAWTSAVISFAVAPSLPSGEPGTFVPLRNSAGGVVSVTVAAETAVSLDPAQFAGFRWLKLRSGTSASPVNQAADRTLDVILRDG